MRTKDLILKVSEKAMESTPPWLNATSVHERLTLEVLIDIRDIIFKRLNLDDSISLIDFELTD